MAEKAAPSARGLFRATGKKSKPIAARMLDGTYQKIDSIEREKDDFYPTPPEPTRAFLAAEIARLRDFTLIWEAAAGDGSMAREIASLGLGVIKSDLVDRGCDAVIKSFYDFGPDEYFLQARTAVVTNPPFGECGWGNGKARWLKHALETLDLEYVALLMSWNWPGAGGLKHFLAKHPISRIYLMAWKIDFTGQGAPPMLNAWFVFDKAHIGETVFRILHRSGDARQSSMFLE